jgi:hypothetical protein
MNDQDQEAAESRHPLILTVPAYNFVVALHPDCLGWSNGGLSPPKILRKKLNQLIPSRPCRRSSTPRRLRPTVVGPLQSCQKRRSLRRRPHFLQIPGEPCAPGHQKPTNIMVSLKGDGRLIAKVIDLGLAKPVADAPTEVAISTPGAFAGTPAFASPEQFAGIGVDIRSDLYCWEWCSGRW